MVGGGIKRDDGLPAISSTNIFSALESRRRKSSKKKLEKERSNSGSKGGAGFLAETQSVAPVWTPTPVTVKSWADCEDDDDYFATVAPPPSTWSSHQPSETVETIKEGLSQGEESDGEEEVEEEVEDDFDEEQEKDESAMVIEDTSKSVPLTATASREPERQLSKKERKKKELAELDAVLAELGLNPKTENDTLDSHDDKKEGDVDDEVNDEEENREGGSTLQESKSARRRKAKKEKTCKEGKDEEVPAILDAEGAKDSDEGDSNLAPADPSKVLKKLASSKKKKSFKESDAAKAAAAEAAIRAAKLAAAKKKEKNHYNQQPVR